MRANLTELEIDELTRAEQAVFVLLCAGHSNKEIAAALGKAGSTIKNQVASIFRKYRVASRAQLFASLLKVILQQDGRRIKSSERLFVQAAR